MTDIELRLNTALKLLRERTDFVPAVALTLGSGLGGFCDNVEVVERIAYADLRTLPLCGVEGHRGAYVFGYLAGVPIVCMQGRVHYYEGYSAQEAVLPVRLTKMMGAKVWIGTNAAGGITYPQVGTLMLLRDHICLVPSPLVGANADTLGPRFPDMSRAYDPTLRQIAKEVAAREKIALEEGVYIQMSGPQFETPAEIAMARAMGADAVGMSTAIETIAVNHMGMRAMAISCVTNPASGIGEGTLSHVDVQAAADAAGENLRKLIVGSVAEMRAKELI